MVGSTFFVSVTLLTLIAPFELTSPLVRLPGQSVSNLEAAVLCAFVCGAAAVVWSRGVPTWQTPLTAPWLALLAAMAVASALSPVSPINAFHMTGRSAAAFGVYLLAANGVTTPARLRSALTLVVAVGVLVSILAILEYRGVRAVLAALKMFRPAVTTVGAQLRAGGPLQYPTIASMYLEVVFAIGLGLMLAALDGSRHGRVALLFVALAVIGEAITLTFTRAGLITMAASLLLVGGLRRTQPRGATGTALLAGLALVIASFVRRIAIGRIGLAAHDQRRAGLLVPRPRRRTGAARTADGGPDDRADRGHQYRTSAVGFIGDAADAAVVPLARGRRRSLPDVRRRADAVCRGGAAGRHRSGERPGPRAAPARTIPARMGRRAGRAAVVQHRARRGSHDLARGRVRRGARQPAGLDAAAAADHPPGPSRAVARRGADVQAYPRPASG
jgi:hypothetical protein